MTADDARTFPQVAARHADPGAGEVGDWQTPEEWCAIKGLHILDPDGWRGRGAPDWDDPISEAEFDERAAISTTGPSR